MDPLVPERKIRILSASPAIVEHDLQELLKSYMAVTWNFAVVAGELVVTVVLVHESEIRKAQLAAMPPMGGPRRQ